MFLPVSIFPAVPAARVECGRGSEPLCAVLPAPAQAESSFPFPLPRLSPSRLLLLALSLSRFPFLFLSLTLPPCIEELASATPRRPPAPAGTPCPCGSSFPFPLPPPLPSRLLLPTLSFLSLARCFSLSLTLPRLSGRAAGQSGRCGPRPWTAPRGRRPCARGPGATCCSCCSCMLPVACPPPPPTPRPHPPASWGGRFSAAHRPP